jgi:hypothetical protein
LVVGIIARVEVIEGCRPPSAFWGGIEMLVIATKSVAEEVV